jgi:predicted nucleic acid-binding protein
MIATVALLDANVLYPALLRDLLLQLAFSGLFQARWSADIDSEWKRNLLLNRPDLETQITATQAMMHRAIPDALVTGFAQLIPGVSLPDPDDRHVLAAAIATTADVIVTYNLKDFPAVTLAAYGIEALHPDEFLKTMAVALPTPFFGSVHECLVRLTRPRISTQSYLAMVERLGLRETAAFLTDNVQHWQIATH